MELEVILAIYILAKIEIPINEDVSITKTVWSWVSCWNSRTVNKFKSDKELQSQGWKQKFPKMFQNFVWDALKYTNSMTSIDV